VPDRPRRLLVLSTSLALGGAERQVKLLAHEFRRRGSEVNVVSMIPLDRPERRLTEAGIGVHSLGMLRTVPDPRGLFRLARLVTQLNPDVIHSHMVHANLLAATIHLLARRPVIITTAHSLHEGSAWRYVAYRLTQRFVDVKTAVSQSVADELARRHAVRKGEVIVVPSGIAAAGHRRSEQTRSDLRQRLGLDGRFGWLAAGRLVAAKAYPLMLAAFALVHAERPEALLVIAGDGPLESELHARVEELGLRDHVRMLGRRDDVPALMSAADGYLMSSEWEGLPIALLEAGAAALPTVATDVAGNGEIVVDGRTGLLVPPGDAGALTNAMLRVMAMGDEERAALGEAARAHVVQHFDLRRVADRWERIYDAAIARRAGAPSDQASAGRR
jgi:glycosyltransferase involved in cell wall biosynthesis